MTGKISVREEGVKRNSEHSLDIFSRVRQSQVYETLKPANTKGYDGVQKWRSAYKIKG